MLGEDHEFYKDVAKLDDMCKENGGYEWQYKDYDKSIYFYELHGEIQN